MGDIDRSETSVAAVLPHCPKCEGDVLLTAMISDVRRSLIIRLYECECGELIWEEKPSISPPEHAATPATDGAINSPS
jgi:hypothetical protein